MGTGGCGDCVGGESAVGVVVASLWQAAGRRMPGLTNGEILVGDRSVLGQVADDADGGAAGGAHGDAGCNSTRRREASALC